MSDQEEEKKTNEFVVVDVNDDGAKQENVDIDRSMDDTQPNLVNDSGDSSQRKKAVDLKIDTTTTDTIPDLPQNTTLSTELTTLSSLSFEDRRFPFATPCHGWPSSRSKCMKYTIRSPPGFTYPLLGLTPTNMKAIKKVNDEICADGAWQKEANDHQVYPLLAFLYAKGYYDGFTVNERVERIKKLISTEKDKDGTYDYHNPRFRLSQLAISDFSLVLQDISEKNVARYRYMAGSVLVLFAKDNIIGKGFPVQPYGRYQTSKNCFLMTATMYLTLCLQSQDPMAHPDPLDMGYIGRRHVIETPEKLELRVLQNKGDKACQICREICPSIHFLNIDLSRFEKQLPEDQSSEKARLVSRAEQGRYAIVSIEPTQKFRDVNKKKRASNNFGYWKFEGSDESAEGTFVDLNNDVENNDTIKARLDELVTKLLCQKEEMEAKMTEREKLVRQMSSSEPLEHDGSEENGDSKEQMGGCEKKTGRPRHAMILVGYIVLVEKEESYPHYPEDFLYVMWNWWENAPLIAMTFEYLQVCQAHIFYNRSIEPIEIGSDFKKCEYLSCDASEPEYTNFNETDCDY